MKILTNLDIKQTINFVENLARKRSTSEDTLVVNAQGKILSNDITSNINVPQYNNSAVDGYAIKFADLKKSNNLLGLIGKNPPGKIFQKSIKHLCLKKSLSLLKKKERKELVL